MINQSSAWKHLRNNFLNANLSVRIESRQNRTEVGHRLWANHIQIYIVGKPIFKYILGKTVHI